MPRVFYPIRGEVLWNVWSISGSLSSCAYRDSGVHHNNPKRKRGFRLLSPRLRFGLVWPIRHASVNRYIVAGDHQARDSMPHSDNIDDVRQAEQELRERQRQLDSLMGHLPGLAYRALGDEHWTCLFVSKGIEDVTGYPPEDFTSHRINYIDIMLPEDRLATREAILTAVRERGTYEDEHRIRHKDGSIRWIWARGHGVFAPGGSLRFLEGLNLDITRASRPSRRSRVRGAVPRHVRERRRRHCPQRHRRPVLARQSGSSARCLRGRSDHAPKDVPVAPRAHPRVPRRAPRGFERPGRLPIREAAHKSCGILSAFSTIAGNQAADLEDVAASGQLDKAAPILAELETIVAELLERVDGISIENLRHRRRPRTSPDRGPVREAVRDYGGPTQSPNAAAGD